MTPLVIIWPSKATDVLASKVEHMMADEVAAKKLRSLRAADLDVAGVRSAVDDAFNSLITLNIAPTLHVAVVAPLWEEEAEPLLAKVLEGIDAVDHPVTTHVAGLREDLAKAATGQPAPPVNRAVPEAARLEAFREQNPRLIFSYSLIDNYVCTGQPIAFTTGALGHYLSIIFAAMAEDYYSVMPPMLAKAEPGTCTLQGCSALIFDRAGAEELLVRRAFTEAIDRQGLERTVDSQMAAQRVRSLLAGIEGRFPKFLENNVLDPLRNNTSGIDIKDQIVADCGRDLPVEINAIESRLTEFIHDPELSLPEKEAVLALLVGFDNDKLSGVQFDSRTAVIDDGMEQPLNLYIDAFNKYGPAGALPLRSDFEQLKLFHTTDSGTIPDPENDRAFNPVPHLKRVQKDILDITAFIRSKDDELKTLLAAEAARQTAETPGDAPAPTLPEGVRRRSSNEVREQPLDAKYVVPQDFKPLDSVDLRPYFSSVRDQGALGSCATFATVAMYEAMMNRFAAPGTPRADLSERFVFYYSNVEKGKSEGGSNFFDQLAVLGTRGVCREELFGYSTEGLDREPPQEAIDDAAGHRVLSALQIPLHDSGDRLECLRQNHRLFTSALSQGFPVGISLAIYDSFGKNGPYINRPDSSDQASGEPGHHAMVLVGYSEADKFYIVRNSWGKDFGDNGYAYISAAYVDDPEYCPFGCIIAQTTDTAGSAPAQVQRLVAALAGTQAQITIAAVRNVLEYAHLELESLQSLYKEYYSYYQRLLQALALPAVRTQICEAAQQAAEGALRSAEKAYADKQAAYSATIASASASLTNSALIVSGIALGLLIVGGFMVGYDGPVEVLIPGAVAAVAAAILWIARKSRIKALRQDLRDELHNLNDNVDGARRRLTELHLRFHTAGMWLDAYQKMIHSIKRTHTRLKSFITNLGSWYADDSRLCSSLPAREGSMFEYLDFPGLLLDTYATHREKILARIDLMATFDSYRVDRETLGEARERLRKSVLEAVAPIFGNFTIADYLCGQNYPFLPPANIDQAVSGLLDHGKPAGRHSAVGADEPSRLLMLRLPAHLSDNAWRNTSDHCFTFPPQRADAPTPDTATLLTLLPLRAEDLK